VIEARFNHPLAHHISSPKLTILQPLDNRTSVK
jgi:hypothetical protein